MPVLLLEHCELYASLSLAAGPPPRIRIGTEWILSPMPAANWASGGYLVQPRLVENRVYAYKAYPQTVEDELDRKDTRLVPSRQCLSTVKRPPALLACVYSRALATLHAVRKEPTMKTTAVIGSTTNPIPYKGGEMSKQTLREGPMGKENHRREGTDLK